MSGAIPGDVGYLGSDALAKRYGEALQRIVDADPSDAVDKLARNALGLTRVPRPKSQPAPELAAAMAETRVAVAQADERKRQRDDLRSLLGEILMSFEDSRSNGWYARVSGTVLDRWRKRAGTPE